jgi:CBS-domain-containing membrane protein
MRIEQLMTKQVQSCSPTDTLERAAQLMWDHDCGCLPVCEGDETARTVGVITDRDICMCSLFHGQPLHSLRVADAMARKVHVCRPGDTISEAENVMRNARIRRLPVINEQNVLIGVISLADLARGAAREQGKTARQITEREVSDTLSAICEPAARSLSA